MPARTSPTSPAAPGRTATSWLISGNKYWCTFADGADFMIIIARTSDAPTGKRSISACPCSSSRRSAARCPRACNGAPIPKIGYFGWKTWELAFDNCRVPAEDMIGEEGQRLLLCHLGRPGDARAPTPRRAPSAWRTARSRIRSPTPRSAGSSASAIADFQAIRFKIASMATEIEAARQLNYFVCDADRHRPALRQGSLDGEAVRLGDGRAR